MKGETMQEGKAEILRQLRAAGEQWVRDHRNKLSVTWSTVIDEWLAECEAGRVRLQQEDAQRKRALDADTLNELREANAIAREAIELAREAIKRSALAKVISLVATFISIGSAAASLYQLIVNLLAQIF